MFPYLQQVHELHTTMVERPPGHAVGSTGPDPAKTTSLQPQRKWKNRTVAQVKAGNRWIHDLAPPPNRGTLRKPFPALDLGRWGAFRWSR